MCVVQVGRWWWIYTLMGDPWQGPYDSQGMAERAMDAELHQSLRGV